MLLGVSHVGFLIMCGGQTAQWMEKYLGFCPMKKADCSYTYIGINYRLCGFYEYLNRHMEDQKEFN